jgi:hypothetical protein
MKPMTGCVLMTTAVLLLAGDLQVRAESVPFSYYYSMSSPWVSSGTGSVLFALQNSSGGATSAVADTLSPIFIPAIAISTTSSAGPDHPDSYNQIPFQLDVQLTDGLSGQVAATPLSFTGVIDGNLFSDQSQASLLFDSPLTLSQALGEFTYSLTIQPESFTLPAPVSGASPVEIQVNVHRNIPVIEDPLPPIKDTPEPTTLALSLTAGSLWWLVRRRRRDGNNR